MSLSLFNIHFSIYHIFHALGVCKLTEQNANEPGCTTSSAKQAISLFIPSYSDNYRASHRFDTGSAIAAPPNFSVQNYTHDTDGSDTYHVIVTEDKRMHFFESRDGRDNPRHWIWPKNNNELTWVKRDDISGIQVRQNIGRPTFVTSGSNTINIFWIDINTNKVTYRPYADDIVLRKYPSNTLILGSQRVPRNQL